MIALGDVPDDVLVDRLLHIRKHERRLLVELLRYLAELDRRKTVLALGYPSLFSFCTEFLGLTKASAFRRTTAARMLARFPPAADYLADGRLNLTTLVELRDVLDERHLVEILDRAAGRTEEQVKELAAALRPQPAPADLLRRLPIQRNDCTRSGPVPVAVSTAQPAPAAPAASPPPAPISPPLTSPTPPPVPTRKKTSTKAPPSGSRYVPVAIRGEVWKRDDGRCTFQGSTGRRCASRHQLQLHHIDPFAMGGPPTVANLTLRCPASQPPRRRAGLRTGSHRPQDRSQPDPWPSCFRGGPPGAVLIPPGEPPLPSSDRSGERELAQKLVPRLNTETDRDRSMQQALIREASTFDAEGIAHVHIESSRDSYAPLAREWPTPDVPDRIARWGRSLEASAGDPKLVDFVATLDGVVVGFIGGGPARRSDIGAELEVYVVHVLPKHRGKGFGGQLWSAACERLRGDPLPSMYVETLAELRCCSFYEAHGGVVARRAPRTSHGGLVTELVYIWPAGRSNERIVRPYPKA
jgi:GNAT superfamily N-acetyltransferase